MALLGLFGLERLTKYFPLPQCVNLVSMRKISGNGEGRDAWFHVRLRCVCSDSGRHRGQRRQGLSQRVRRGDTAESYVVSGLGCQVSGLFSGPGAEPSGVDVKFESQTVPGLRPS